MGVLHLLFLAFHLHATINSSCPRFIIFHSNPFCVITPVWKMILITFAMEVAFGTLTSYDFCIPKDSVLKLQTTLIFVCICETNEQRLYLIKFVYEVGNALEWTTHLNAYFGILSPNSQDGLRAHFHVPTNLAKTMNWRKLKLFHVEV